MLHRAFLPRALLGGLLLLAAAPATAATFGFDALAPTNGAVPFTLSSGGVTARFSSPSGPGAFIAEDGSGFATLGTSVLANDNFVPEELDIGFSRSLANIGFAFATNDGGAPTAVTLTALQNGTKVGSVVATGRVAASGLPEGALAFGGALFNAVQITDAGAGNAGFAIGAVNATVPEPASAAALLAGVFGALAARRRRA